MGGRYIFMKILIATELLRLGGAEAVATDLANSLLNCGYDVFFCAAPGPVKERLDSKIEFFPIDEFSIWTLPKVTHSLFRIIHKVKPDIIHSQSAALAILCGTAVKCLKMRTKVIFTHHSKTFSRLPSLPGSYLLRLCLDHFVALTRWKYDGFLSMGIANDMISLIPNMVDCNAIENKVKHVNNDQVYERSGIGENSCVLCMAGRLLPAKGFDRFIRVVAECSKTHKNMNFVGLIIGEGPFRKDLEALAISDNANIRFLGYQDDVFQYLAISDLVVFPSRQEVLPMFLIEATAAGVPIVCSDIPGNRDIVEHGVNGFLVDEFNDELYCEYVLRLATDQKIAGQFSKAGKKLAWTSFDKNVVVDKIVNLYRKISNG
jgi:glycosyltransferase involved in cell wall biosynthesis